MVDSSTVRQAVKGFITSNFLFGDEKKLPTDSDSLIGNGILDSTGILELVDFLEKDFSVVVEDHETIPENLDSINNIVNFIGVKAAS